MRVDFAAFLLCFEHSFSCLTPDFFIWYVIELETQNFDQVKITMCMCGLKFTNLSLNKFHYANLGLQK